MTHQIEVRYSDDGGNNWSPWRTIELGQTGQFKGIGRLRRLGSTFLRVWHIRDSSDYKSDLMAMSAQYESEG